MSKYREMLCRPTTYQYHRPSVTNRDGGKGGCVRCLIRGDFGIELHLEMCRSKQRREAQVVVGTVDAFQAVDIDNDALR